jgi:ribosomal protein S1
LKQLTDDPWSSVQASYEIGQVRTGRITRLAEFGAFVEFEPGVEGLAHVSTFPPGKSGAWAKSVVAGTTGTFEILSVDPEKKRIGVALVEEGSTRALRADSIAGVQHVRDTEDVQEYSERRDVAPTEAFGSLADKLRGALTRGKK